MSTMGELKETRTRSIFPVGFFFLPNSITGFVDILRDLLYSLVIPEYDDNQQITGGTPLSGSTLADIQWSFALWKRLQPLVHIGFRHLCDDVLGKSGGSFFGEKNHRV